jgi:hypothetical protein
MENNELVDIVKNYARTTKEVCLKFIANEISPADRNMYLRAIIADMENLVKEVARHEGTY